MQLFTVGLYVLNTDGTPKKTGNGKRVRTYNNDDVMEFARVWTGLRSQPQRGNGATAERNRIDPMRIELAWRDMFPKMGLNGKYIGDGYPLCADLPHQHFLKRGAKYRLLGYSSQPELQDDPPEWLDRRDYVTIEANELAATAGTRSTSLYDVLCDAEISSFWQSPCRHPPVVTLTENLECHGDKECSVDSVRTVKVGDVFYEYVQLPCVHQAFFDKPQKIKKRDRLEYGSMYMCGDPRTEVAAAACCLKNGMDDLAYADTLYWGERVQLSTAKQRCKDLAVSERRNFDMCTSTGNLRWARGWAFGTPYLWFGDVPCNVQAKVDQDGKVAVVHSVPDENPMKQRQTLQTDDDTVVRHTFVLTCGQHK